MVDATPDGSIFEIKNAAPEASVPKTIDYIPKKPSMEHLKKIDRQHKEKVEKYKVYAHDLKERYQKYEIDS